MYIIGESKKDYQSKSTKDAYNTQIHFNIENLEYLTIPLRIEKNEFVVREKLNLNPNMSRSGSFNIHVDKYFSPLYTITCSKLPTHL